MQEGFGPKDMDTVELSTQEYRDLALCAFRYALGRQSYVVSSVVDILDQYWDRLSSDQQTLVREEIQEAIEEDRAGADIDVDDWRRLCQLPPQD